MSVFRKIPIQVQRKSAVYRVGEKIVFELAPIKEAFYQINDGKSVSELRKADEKIVVTAQKPGFILVKICGSYRNGRRFESVAGAAVEPENILPGTILPDDFDTVWESELSSLRRHPLEVTVFAPVDKKIVPDRIKAFDVHIRRGEITVSGFLAYPENGAVLPGVLSFLGASKVTSESAVAFHDAEKYQCAAFNVNFHGLVNLAVRNAEKEAAMRESVANYQYLNADDFADYAMRKIFLRCAVAADYLLSLPQCNGKLAVHGGSLGGCQSIVTAALIPQVKYCCATACAMSDHFGKRAGHLPGWPNLLASDAVPAGAEKIAAYFDMVNFARRIKCPVVMAVGFVDEVTPPASTYAAYNSLSVKKRRMYHVISGSHGPVLDQKEQSVFDQGESDFAAAVKKLH